MRQFRLQRDTDVDLMFNGELLGAATSERPGVQRWTDIVIFRTDTGKYVVQQVGRSIKPGEHDRYQASVCHDVFQVRDVLKTGNRDYLTHVARLAIEQAAIIDAEFNNITVEQV